MDYTIASGTTAIGSGDAAPATGTPGEFTNGNPATSTPATTVPGYQLNAIVQEIINAINGAGLAPDKTNNGQLLAAIKALSFGGATAQDMTASRAFDTVYTNSTARAIFLSVEVLFTGATGTSNSVKMLLGGTETAVMGGVSTYNPNGMLYAVVPPGGTYEVTSLGSVSLSKWSEVR